MSNSLIQSSRNGFPARGPVIEAVAPPPPPNSQYRRYFLFLLRYWWIPFTTLVLAVAAAVALNHWAQPEDVSSAAMWETEKLLLPGGAAFSADGQTYMGTQLELLHSSGLLRRTVARMQALNPKSCTPRQGRQSAENHDLRSPGSQDHRLRGGRLLS